MPTTTHAAVGSARYGFGCAIALRRGHYWVGNINDNDVHRRALSSGVVEAIVDFGIVKPITMALTADNEYLLVANTGTAPIKSVSTRSDTIDDTGATHTADDVSVCDDGTILTAAGGNTAHFVTYTVDDNTGELTQLAAVPSISRLNTACSPGSGFFVASSHPNTVVESFALSPLTGTAIDSVTLATTAVTIVFNPINSDVYLLEFEGQLSMFAFNSNNGEFGALKAQVNTGGIYFGSGIEQMGFAYGKLFTHSGDQLVTYDAGLNLLSSHQVIDDDKKSICFSEGTMLLLSLLCLIIQLIEEYF
jgi:hypothetical protein